MMTIFMYLCTNIFRSNESGFAQSMLLEVPHDQVTLLEELGRGTSGRVYKSVMKRLPEEMTSSKLNEHSLDAHKGCIVAIKVLPGELIQN